MYIAIEIKKVMRILKFTLTLLIVIITNLSFAQLPVDITTGFKKGNTESLAPYLNDNVELFINDKDDVYSKAQVKQILVNFFAENTVVEFNVVHQSSRKDSQYAICNMSCNNIKYRVSFLLRIVNQNPLIHQLRIEKL